MSKHPKLIVIVGPTASGKSDLAVDLAKRYGGEIISADSRQVYKGLDIGSGKVPRDKTRTSHLAPRTYFYRGIPHHLLDVASPRRTYTAADFKRDAKRAIKDILRRGRLPIIVGGTGFYIDSLLYDAPLPDVRPDIKLRRRLDKKTAEELFEELKEADPERAANIDRHNKRRLIRALEIIRSTGAPVPKPADRKARYDILKIGINRAPEELRKRIHTRLLSRMKKGMVREVKDLHKNGLSWKRLDDLGLEYRYVSRYLRTLPRLSSRAESRDLMRQMLSKLESEIWHYARRQMTWFRRDPEIQWYGIDEITHNANSLLR